VPARAGQRRGHGEGSFRETPSGKWEGAQWVAEVGRRVSVTGDTEKQARGKLKARVEAVRAGISPARRAAVTFGDYAEHVIAQREGIGNRTRDLYRTNLRLYLAPLHGQRLDKITPEMLRGRYAEMRAAGLSSTVRGHAHTLARMVLETARLDGKIARNPANVPGVRPKAERGAEKSVQAYDAAQAALILKAAGQVTHGEIVACLLLTGMRRGEVCALRWDAVDLTRGTAQVRVTRSVSGTTVYEGTPKTAQSRRTVPLVPEVVQLLDETRARNEARRVRLYAGHEPSPYVFPSLTGTPPTPDNLRRTFQQVLDKVDGWAREEERQRAEQTGEAPRRVALMPRLPVHSLRHTFVSLMAARGVRLEVIAAWIGDNPATVMKVYLHVFQVDTAMPSLNLGQFERVAS
jgi:integrase